MLRRWEYYKIIWFYQLSWQCKLATAKTFAWWIQKLITGHIPPIGSRIALCLWRLLTIFSGTFIRARPLANTDHPTIQILYGDAAYHSPSPPCKTRKSVVSYTNSPLSFQCNTSEFSLILSNSCVAPALKSLGTLFMTSCSTAEVGIVSA